MTRAVVTARIASPSSSESETSQKSSRGPHTPNTYSIANMHLLHKKSVDVANDLDLFVYDSSDYELNNEAGFNCLRGRARDRPKRSRSFPKSTEVVAKLMQPPSRRGRSAGPKANLLRKAKGEAEIEAQRQRDAQDDYDTADFITVPPSYLAKRDRWTILPDRQDRSPSPTTLRIPGTQNLPSILRSPRNSAIDVVTELVPRLTFARRPSHTEGSDFLSPTQTYVSSSKIISNPFSSRGTRRLSFAVDPTDPTNPTKLRRMSKTVMKVSDNAIDPGSSRVDKQAPRRPSNDSLPGSNLALRSRTSSTRSYTSTAPPTFRRASPSASSTPSLSINTSSKRGTSRFRSSGAPSSPIFFLPTSPNVGSSAGFSPVRSLASASATVTLCKVCATYHPPTTSGNAQGSEGEDEGESVTLTDASWWGVAASAPPRRRSLPELLLYASGARGSGSEVASNLAGTDGGRNDSIASSTKIGSFKGKTTGRGRSESDTRALLWSIQASAGKIL